MRSLCVRSDWRSLRRVDGAEQFVTERSVRDYGRIVSQLDWGRAVGHTIMGISRAQNECERVV